MELINTCSIYTYPSSCWGMYDVRKKATVYSGEGGNNEDSDGSKGRWGVSRDKKEKTKGILRR